MDCGNEGRGGVRLRPDSVTSLTQPVSRARVTGASLRRRFDACGKEENGGNAELVRGIS